MFTVALNARFGSMYLYIYTRVLGVRTIHFECRFNRLPRANANVMLLMLLNCYCRRRLMPFSWMFVCVCVVTAATHCDAYESNANANSFLVHVIVAARAAIQLSIRNSHVLSVVVCVVHESVRIATLIKRYHAWIHLSELEPDQGREHRQMHEEKIKLSEDEDARIFCIRIEIGYDNCWCALA